MRAGTATDQAKGFATRGVVGATAKGGGVAGLGLGEPLVGERIAAERSFAAPAAKAAMVLGKS